jgi:hypothetical protein
MLSAWQSNKHFQHEESNIMSWKEFLDLIIAWATTNEQEIKIMWPQKGGWEEWAKPTIFKYVTNQYPAVNLLREQPVFNNPRKDADFLLNDDRQVGEKVIVEVKAQSFNNYTNFTTEVKKDIKKLTGEVKPSYAGSTLMVIGFYFTTEKTEIPNYFSKQVIGSGEIGICWAVDQG